MVTVISPAKSLNFENIPDVPQYTVPEFLNEAGYLIGKLRKLNPARIGKMMDISENLAQLNYSRYHEFHTPFTPENAAPAVMVFNGDVYQGLQARTLNASELTFAQEHLRILSGLYGLIKPLDLIQAYRLEMGTDFSVTPTKKNLYQFWGNSITDKLNAALKNQDNPVLIHLASHEYFKVINTKKLKAAVITCEFKEEKPDGFKMVTFFAKKARGLMTNFIIKNKLNKAEDLLDFNMEGYLYNPKLSTKNLFTYTRVTK